MSVFAVLLFIALGNSACITTDDGGYVCSANVAVHDIMQ